MLVSCDNYCFTVWVRFLNTYLQFAYACYRLLMCSILVNVNAPSLFLFVDWNYVSQTYSQYEIRATSLFLVPREDLRQGLNIALLYSLRNIQESHYGYSQCIRINRPSAKAKLKTSNRHARVQSIQIVTFCNLINRMPEELKGLHFFNRIYLWLLPLMKEQRLYHRNFFKSTSCVSSDLRSTPIWKQFSLNAAIVLLAIEEAWLPVFYAIISSQWAICHLVFWWRGNWIVPCWHAPSLGMRSLRHLSSLSKANNSSHTAQSV